MRCENCGTAVGASGHRCPYGRQVSVGSVETFAEAGQRVIRFAAIFAVVVLAMVGLGYARLTAIRGGSVDPSSVGTQAGFALTTMVIGFIGWVGILGLLVSTIVWIVSAHRLTPRGPGAIGYGALVGFVVLFGLSYVLHESAGPAPLASAPALIAPAVPEATGSAQAGSEQTDRKPAGSEQVDREQAESEQAGSEQAGSEQVGSELAGSGRSSWRTRRVCALRVARAGARAETPPEARSAVSARADREAADAPHGRDGMPGRQDRQCPDRSSRDQFDASAQEWHGASAESVPRPYGYGQREAG